MASAIENEFGISAELIEGHNGIYEVAIDGNIVYTNKEVCGQLPENEQIIQQIRDHRSALPQQDAMENVQDKDNSRAGVEDASETLAAQAASSPGSAESTGPDQCCSGGRSAGSADCCPASQDDVAGGADSSGRSWGSLTIFVLVILMAVGVGSYSVLKRSARKTQAPKKPLIASTSQDKPAPSTPAADLATAAAETQAPKKPPITSSSAVKAGKSTKAAAADERPSKAAAVSCGVTLKSAESLEKLAADKDAVFVFLSGENDQQAQAVSRRVKAVVNKLSSRGKKVAAFTLNKDADGYDQFAKQFSVQSLPCVVVSGQGCESPKLTGDITEDRLIRAFVEATVPVSSCGPQSDSSCCPQ